ncbi:MAG: anthranilate synthase component I family protein [Flavobacteriales bacterium]|nr:MAG: anthranilate synthase component I family protein [Flavobacteriales bacterium]
MLAKVEAIVSGTPNWRALRRFSTAQAVRLRNGGGWLMGLGAARVVEHGAPGAAFHALGRFCAGAAGPVFFQVAYGAGEEVVQGLRLKPPAQPGPCMLAFAPRFIVRWAGDLCAVEHEANDRFQAEELLKALTEGAEVSAPTSTEWSVPDRATYLSGVGELMEHIQRGDIYEVNYCTERNAVDPAFDPYDAFHRLDARLQAAHAAFAKHDGRYALCQSPELFLDVTGRRVRGEPMKGTRPRQDDPIVDAQLARELAADPKERSENIMAVDVLRHDLSQVSMPGSVQVPDLCRVRTIPAVHQMISIVAADLLPGKDAMDAMRVCFPPASMTGAPKRRAMELIDAHEERGRGLYSGTIGVVDPDGSAHMNVVIRTILFDASTGRLSLSTGSALTATCDPLKEWDECEVKARSVIDALHHGG